MKHFFLLINEHLTYKSVRKQISFILTKTFHYQQLLSDNQYQLKGSVLHLEVDGCNFHVYRKRREKIQFTAH